MVTGYQQNQRPSHWVDIPSAKLFSFNTNSIERSSKSAVMHQAWPFDMNGTLVDSEPFNGMALSRAFRSSRGNVDSFICIDGMGNGLSR